MKKRAFVLMFFFTIFSLAADDADYYYIQGMIFYNQGNYTKAIESFLEAKDIYEKTLGREHPDYALSLNNLGVLYNSTGNYTQAEKYYLEVKAVWERVLGKNHPNYAASLSNLGSLYYSMGEYAQAEQCFLEAIGIQERVLGKDHSDYALSLNNLGALNRIMGDYARAERYYLEAKAIREKAQETEQPDYAALLSNLGALYWIMKNYAQAEQYYLEAKAIEERILGKDHPRYATTLNNLGNLYNSMEDYAQAERFHLEAKAIREKALGKDHPGYANSLNNLGGVCMDIGDYVRAEQYFLEAKSIEERVLGKEHPSYARSLDNLYGVYLSARNYSRAFTYKQESNNLHKTLLIRNFSFLSEQQREAYWNSNSKSLEAAYSLSHFYSVPESNALNYDNALFSKGLLLRTTNAVRDAIYNSGDQTLIAQYEKLGNLRQQASALRQSGGNTANIQNLEQEADALEKSLTQASSAFREFQASLELSWTDVQKSLQKNEAAIEFVSFKLFDKKWTDTILYAALVLRPGMEAPVWIPLCRETALAEIFEQLRGLNPVEQTQILYDKYGSEVYKAVWQPLEKILEGVKVVYYSPSGLLHKISFNAIPAAGNRLIDLFDLNLLSTTREIVYRQARVKQRPESAVIYGGLFYDSSADEMHQAARGYNPPKNRTRGFVQDDDTGIAWGYLPATLPESETIQGLFSRNRTAAELFSKNTGNEESFKALSGKKTPVIHLATHGFFFEDIERDYEERERLERLGGGSKALENPLLRSGLIFAGANNAWLNKAVDGVEDGILFADEVAGMNLLGTELVALSACETALGEVNNSEGVFGLQRAFKLAGADSLIMSLWKVSDDATSELMRSFYTNWLSGKSKQEALKEAQKALRSNPKYNAPFYWAAFIMMD